MSTTWVGLPAYNEQQALRPLLERILQADRRYRIVVVNDGSQDDTRALVERYQAAHPTVTLLNHEVNRGLGAALNTLIEWVAAHAGPADLLAIMDADNTHEPQTIAAMVEHLRREQVDIVIASRFVRGARAEGVSLLRRLYSRGATAVYRTTFPYGPVRDYTSGYRLYRVKLLQEALVVQRPLLQYRGFEATTELLLRLRQLGAKASEYPIDLAYRNRGTNSKMNVKKTLQGHLNLIKQMRRL